MTDKLPQAIRIAPDGNKLYLAAREDEGAEYVRGDLAYQRWNETSLRLSEAGLLIRRLGFTLQTIQKEAFETDTYIYDIASEALELLANRMEDAK